jgi:Bifunctional DNA primase/polymerase, N-terminal/Primase C terminal 1 (PriCT-1)
MSGTEGKGAGATAPVPAIGAAADWAIFPLHTPAGDGCSCRKPGCENVGKHPRTANGLKDATADPELLLKWWSMWPQANVGVRTGAESGIVILDVDPCRGGDDALHGLERAHGALPATIEALTGGGGRHIYFKHPGQEIRNSADKLGPGLDIRGDGGYVVAPPSIHASGRAYCWAVDSGPDDVELAELPGWLAQRLKQHSNGHAHPLEDWRELAANGVAEGARNERAAQLTGHLLARGVDPFVTLELLLAWDAQRNRPPLGGDVIARTVRSIARREATKWMS